jgi:hypothetical protein
MIENNVLKEIYRVWKTAYDSSTDVTEKQAAGDILAIIQELIEYKIELAAIKNPVWNKKFARRAVLTAIGIPEKWLNFHDEKESH